MIKAFIVLCALVVVNSGLVGQASFTLTITGIPEPSGIKLSLIRESPARGHYLVDTFARHDNGKALLRLFDIRYPCTGWLVNTGDTIRKIFIIPGHNASVNFPVADTIRQFPPGGSFAWSGTVQVSGTSSGMQTLFDKMVSEDFPAFMENFLAASEKNKNYLLDSALKTVGKLSDEHRPFRDFYVRKLILTAIDFSTTLSGLNDAQILYLPCFKAFAYPSFKTDIDQRYQSHLNYLLAQQERQPAFAFALPDTSGTMHHLSDFKGKVVYLDLWASWCLPCRLESVHMKKLVRRYGKREDLVFIGIAVSDNIKDWKKALRQDQPAWLQLRDTGNLIANAYAARSIPRYVLIDKAGKVARFFAPAPGDEKSIISLIEKELNN